MSRLIDVDMLIKKIDRYTRTNNVEFNIACKYIIEVVKEQPTAFDVEKVVEQLDNLRKEYETEANNINTPPNYTCYYKGHMRGYEHSIDIVKRGGIEVINSKKV